MTRKDYIVLARALKDARENMKFEQNSAHVLNVTTEYIAQELQKDNPRFKRMKFYEAAGRC